jgi:hypothetical protein
VNNHPIVKKLYLLTSTLDKSQLETLLAQVKAKNYASMVAWFQGQGNELTAEELALLNGEGRPAYIGVFLISELIGVWERERRVKFVSDAVKDELKPIRLVVIDKAVLAGETEEYGKEVFLDALKDLVGELSNG